MAGLGALLQVKPLAVRARTSPRGGRRLTISIYATIYVDIGLPEGGIRAKMAPDTTAERELSPPDCAGGRGLQVKETQ
jgi:hypothetical protein